MSTVSDVTNVNYSGDNRVDSLLYSGADWNYLLPIRTTLFYTFDLSFVSSEVSGASSFNASQQAAAQAILAYASSVTGVSFTRTNSGATADFHFANTNIAGSTTAGLCQTLESYSFTSNNVLTSYNAEAIVMLDNVEFFSINNTLTAGSSGYEVLLHEIGHALGLGHPFDGEFLLPTEQDNTNNTVMSYTAAGADKSTFQSYDLLALDWIYGQDGLGGSHGFNSTFGPSLGGVTNSAPVAANGSASTREDIALAATLPGATDANGDAITYALASNAAHGLVTVNANGSYSYTPAANYNGSDSFSFTVSDPSNASNSYTMTLSVQAVNDAPTGSVTVAGSAVQGQTLNAANTLADVDGIPTGSIRYQWRADNVTLSGATTSTLVLSGSHVGKAITVTASYVDAQGTNESVSSNPTALVTASDTTAPTVTTFTPADEATGVAVASNIVVTFSEAVVRGTGNILLKTAAGVTVATLDAATSSNLSIAGNTLTINPTADLAFGTGYRIEFGAGSIKDVAGNAFAGTTSYNFTTVANIANQTFTGTTAADTFTSRPGNDTIDGGAGIDTVAFNGNLSNYTLTKSGSTYTVRAKTGTDGTDTLTNVESLKFTDLSVNLQVKSIAAAAPLADVQRISELYVAFFNRTPDADGLAYWIDQKTAGQSINQISEAFYNVGASSTFSALTGFSTSMTNEDFLNVFYKNVLGRPEGADAGGLAYWNGKLADGSSTRSSLANDILDSAHTFKGDPTWGFVADLLDNKIAVANTIAVEWGLTYNTDAYARGVAIAAAITPTNITEALKLVGVSAVDFNIA